MKNKTLIVIPFYNHFSCFKQVAKRFASEKQDILVVNDGSTVIETNQLVQLCKKYSFSYIFSGKNSGKGAAVLMGMQYALAKGYTHLLQIDADGQHSISDIKKFLKKSAEYPDSIINGNPIYGKEAPKSRLYGRKITTFWVSIETGGAKIGDTMCGFRVYPLHLIKKIIPILYFKRMGFDTEIIVKSYLNKINIIDIPTCVKYPKSGMSHFRPLHDNLLISIMHASLCCYAIYKLLFSWRKNV